MTGGRLSVATTVDTISSGQGIVSTQTGQDVVVGSAVERIIFATASERVVAVTAGQHRTTQRRVGRDCDLIITAKCIKH